MALLSFGNLDPPVHFGPPCIFSKNGITSQFLEDGDWGLGEGSIRPKTNILLIPQSVLGFKRIGMFLKNWQGLC